MRVSGAAAAGAPAARPAPWPAQRRCRRRAAAACRAQPEPVCLGQLDSEHNEVVAVYEVPDTRHFPAEVRGARVLLLDSSGNLHSVYRAGQPLTGAYWDALAVLPAWCPPGPLAVLGLGAGTVAHLVAALFPGRVTHGWELDAAVVELAQQHMGLAPLVRDGALVVHVGDALDAAAASVGPAGAAGIVVDLFARAALIPQLTEADAWRGVRARLAPGGRAIANLGAAPDAARAAGDPHAATTRAALAAMAEAFEGQLNCCSMVTGHAANLVAVSGPPLTTDDLAAVPAPLQAYARGWRPWAAAQW
ncbi:hypothetical protein HT031_001214 [Scenedesmus sp. PABB004]|nr:hypothetical protein HT031_001214 [Scenedesmus sp. PABB004]